MNNIFSVSNAFGLALSGVIVITNDILINSVLLYIILHKLYQVLSHLDVMYVDLMQQHILVIEQTEQNEQNEQNNQNKENQQNNSHDMNNIAIDNNINNNHRNRTMDSCSDENNILNDLNRNKYNQNEIVDLMAKMSLLTIFSTFFAQFFNLAVLHSEYYVLTHNNITNQWYNNHAILRYSLRSVEGFTNCLILYFTFPFNQTQYFQCCSIFHTCLRNCCIRCITNSRRNEK